MVAGWQVEGLPARHFARCCQVQQGRQGGGGSSKPTVTSAIDLGWVAVADAGYKGLGLFATTDIPAGAMIGHYAGELLTARDYVKRYPLGDSVYTFQMNNGQRRDLLYQDARDPALSNLTRFINHDGIVPNLVVTVEEKEEQQTMPMPMPMPMPVPIPIPMPGKTRKRLSYTVIFNTTRVIKAGEELCFHYGDKYPIKLYPIT
jgi:SET domain-containing protein